MFFLNFLIVFHKNYLFFYMGIWSTLIIWHGIMGSFYDLHTKVWNKRAGASNFILIVSRSTYDMGNRKMMITALFALLFVIVATYTEGFIFIFVFKPSTFACSLCSKLFPSPVLHVRFPMAWFVFAMPHTATHSTNHWHRHRLTVLSWCPLVT